MSTDIPISAGSWSDLALIQKKAMIDHNGAADTSTWNAYPVTPIDVADGLVSFWQNQIGQAKNATGGAVASNLGDALSRIFERHDAGSVEWNDASFWSLGEHWYSGTVGTLKDGQLGRKLGGNTLDGKDTVIFWDGIQKAAIELQAVRSYDPSVYDVAIDAVGEAIKEAPENFAKGVASITEWLAELASKTLGGAVAGVFKGLAKDPITAVLLVAAIGVGGYYLYTKVQT